MSTEKIITDEFSKRLFDTLVESTDDLVYVVSSDGRYLEFNERGLGTCGLTRDDVIGKTPDDVFDEDLARIIKSNNDRVLKTGRPLVTQEWMSLGGSRRCFSTFLSPVDDEDGNSRCLIGLSRDVTDSKRLVEELKIYEQQVDSLFAERAHLGKLIQDITREAIACPSVDDFIEFVARKLGESIDVSRVDIFKFNNIRNKVTCTHEWCAKGVEQKRKMIQNLPVATQSWLSEEMLAGKSIEISDYAKMRPSELKKLMKSHEAKAVLAVPIYVFGQPYGFIGFDECRGPRDWSNIEVELLGGMARIIAQKVERHQLEENILVAERLASTGRLTATITHEINNPLQGIVLHLETLEEVVPEEGKVSLERVKEGVNQVKEVISRFLEVHRRDDAIAEVDVNILLKEAFQLVGHVVKMKCVRITWDLEKGLPELLGDDRKIHQVFLNIFLNALDSMEAGGELHVSTMQEDRNLVVCVRDTGCGISGEVLPYIFDPFYTTKGRKGTGLGLFVSHSIMSEYGGRIEVLSKKGEGAEVRMTFPLTDDQTSSQPHKSKRK